MSENFEKLKRIGAQKIHEVTHIPRVHIQSILNENFEDMNSVQLQGFIYVLEREYSLDLSDLREKAKEHFEKNKPNIRRGNSATLLIASKKKRSFTFIYVLLALAIFVAFAFYNIQSKESEISIVDNSAIKSAQSNISVSVDDKNLSKTDENMTQNIQPAPEPTLKQQESIQNPIESAVQQEAPKSEVEPIEESIKTDLNNSAAAPSVKEIKQEEALSKKESNETKEVIRSSAESINKESAIAASSFKITSKNKVWLGYIDLGNRKQNQKTFSGEFTLDPSRNWLISLGHGFVDIEINGVVTTFTKAQNIRFSYIDSQIKEIDAEEFKSLNKGKTW